MSLDKIMQDETHEFTSMTGDKIVLTPITKEDTFNIVRWRNSSSVRKNFIYRDVLTESTHNNWLKTMVETGKVAQFIISEKSSGLKIGCVYLRDIDKVHGHAEYGIYIGEPEGRGKGYGTEAANLMCGYGFTVLGLHKIFLRVLASNTSAIHSYEKAGFTTEGYFKDHVFLDGKYVDVVFMAKFQ